MANQPAGFQFAKPYDPTNPVSSDMRYGKYNGTTTIPFVNTTEALDLIKPALRYQGLQCVIVNGSSVSLYWFRNGTADTDLVLLQTDIDTDGFELADNKVIAVRNLPDASDGNYPSERAVRILANTHQQDIADADGKAEAALDAYEQEITDRNNAIAAAVLNLQDGVAPQYNTLKKIVQAFAGFQTQQSFETFAAFQAFNVTNLPFQAFVENDGDGRWALYQATTTGVNAGYRKISDPDLLNAAMTDAQIKAAYERNGNTNAFTDAFKSKLDGITSDFTFSFPQPVRFYKDYFANTATIINAIGDGVTQIRYSTNGGTSYTPINLPFSGTMVIPAGWVLWRIDFPNSAVAIAAVNIKLLS